MVDQSKHIQKTHSLIFTVREPPTGLFVIFLRIHVIVIKNDEFAIKAHDLRKDDEFAYKKGKV